MVTNEKVKFVPSDARDTINGRSNAFPETLRVISLSPLAKRTVLLKIPDCMGAKSTSMFVVPETGTSNTKLDTAPAFRKANGWVTVAVTFRMEAVRLLTTKL